MINYTIIFFFCFQQDDLDSTVLVWNTHPIRKYSLADTQPGKPVILYHAPQLYGKHDCLKDVSRELILACHDEVQSELYPCEKWFCELCCIIMAEHDLLAPTNKRNAVLLYTFLRLEIADNLSNL